jgi:hypothetical protein
MEANPAVYIPEQSTQDNADQRRLYLGCTVQGTTACTYSSVGEIAGIANATSDALQTS